MITILVVEDNQDDFQSLEKIFLSFRTKNYQLKQLYSIHPEQLKEIDYDVLILSCSTPIQVSVLLLNTILKQDLNRAIIFLTNQFDEKVSETIIHHGADDCLPKNELTPIFLEHAINQVLQRKKIEAKLSVMATHDQLTGLANRYLLNVHLEHAISLAKRTQAQFAVLFIDVDEFKLINDSLGHQSGDLLLKQISARLTATVRETDIIARLGNNEFGLLLENSGTVNNSINIAKKIQETMAKVFHIHNHELFITVSIGIACFPECGTLSTSLFKNAGTALNKAKEMGRNQFHFFTGDLSKQARLKLELEKNLRRALINREFEIYLQPQICSKTEIISGAESLLRWNHPKYGFIAPDIFIPLLEELGLLTGVESWVLREVCFIAKQLTDEYGKLRFSVNISGSHFNTGHLKENIYLALQASSLEARFLEIELTEDTMIEHVEHNCQLLNELKAMGISIALDDFGKGYSSLSYLKNFPADVLKIDKAFINNLVTDNRDSAIVEALVELSHKLGIEVVAEGVESYKQFAHLQSIECDLIQGYYFTKPLAITEFIKFLVNKRCHSAALCVSIAQSKK